MNLQNLYYLTSIVFMILLMVTFTAVAVLLFDLINRFRDITRKARRFIDEASESGIRIMHSTEKIIPKIVSAISFADLIRDLVNRFGQKKAESKKTKSE